MPTSDRGGDSYERERAASAAHHDRVARAYDRDLFVRALRRSELAAFGALVPPPPADARALDFGCGTGRQTRELLARGLRVDAYDVSAAMRETVRASLGDSGDRLRVLDSESAVDPGAYALISCVGVLDYYGDPFPLVERLAAARAPGGAIILSFPDRWSPLGWLYLLGSMLFTGDSHVHGLSDLAAVGARLGLRVTGHRRSPRLLGGMIRFARLEGVA